MEIIIDPEFKKYLGRLNDESRQALEDSLKLEGCRDGLVVWPQEDGTAILLDGHNRHELCTKLDVKYWTINCPETVVDRQTALAWILGNQQARRNLTKAEFTYLIGMAYKTAKATQGGDRGNQYTVASDQNDHLPKTTTAERLAEKYGVSAPTIRRAEKAVDEIDAVAAEHGPEAKAEILAGRKKVFDYVEADEAAKASLRVEPDVKTGNHAPIPDCQVVPEMIPGETPPAPPPKVTRGNIEAGVLLMDGLSIILAKLEEMTEVGTPDRKSLPAILQSIGEAETHLRDLSRALTEGAQ